MKIRRGNNLTRKAQIIFIMIEHPLFLHTWFLLLLSFSQPPSPEQNNIKPTRNLVLCMKTFHLSVIFSSQKTWQKKVGKSFVDA